MHVKDHGSGESVPNTVGLPSGAGRDGTLSQVRGVVQGWMNWFACQERGTVGMSRNKSTDREVERSAAKVGMEESLASAEHKQLVDRYYEQGMSADDAARAAHQSRDGSSDGSLRDYLTKDHKQKRRDAGRGR